MEQFLELSTNRKILVFGLPIVLLAFSIWLAKSSYAVNYPELYAGITYDLILTIPLAVYFLSKRKVSKFVVGLFVSIGIVTAYFVIPASEKFHFDLIRFVLLPAIEFIIIGSIVYVTYKTVKGAKKTSNQRIDYLITFQESGVKAFKNQLFGKLFGAELVMIHYAFFNWKSKPLSKNEFSYHHKNGSISLLIGVLMIIVVETIGVHFLLAKWSIIAAWVMTVLSIYTFIMLFAHLKAVLHRPHVFNSDDLELKLGLFGTAKIPYDKIESIQFANKISEELKADSCQFTPLGDSESFNVIIHLKKPIDCEFMYGFKRKYKTIMTSVDDVEGFKRYSNKITEHRFISNSLKD